MKRLVIFGSGDFAAVARFYFQHDSDYEVAAFTVTADAIGAREVDGLPVVPFEGLVETHPPDDFEVFVAVAYSRVNKNRQEFFERAEAKGYRLARYVCSKAITWPGLEVGEGSFVFEANVIQPFVRIGRNTVLWSGNHIGHHSRIGDHVFIASHVVVSGNCRIGDNSFLGVNATLRDGLEVGRECVVGAGVLLLKDAPAGSVFKGTATSPMDISSERLSRI